MVRMLCLSLAFSLFNVTYDCFSKWENGCFTVLAGTKRVDKLSRAPMKEIFSSPSIDSKI